MLLFLQVSLAESMLGFVGGLLKQPGPSARLRHLCLLTKMLIGMSFYKIQCLRRPSVESFNEDIFESILPHYHCCGAHEAQTPLVSPAIKFSVMDFDFFGGSAVVQKKEDYEE